MELHLRLVISMGVMVLKVAKDRHHRDLEDEVRPHQDLEDEVLLLQELFHQDLLHLDWEDEDRPHQDLVDVTNQTDSTIVQNLSKVSQVMNMVAITNLGLLLCLVQMEVLQMEVRQITQEPTHSWMSK